MKAITLSQPYATMIANGEKWVENRTWPTRYRGPLAIHAGKGTQYVTAKQLLHYQTSCVVATCNLVACVEYELVYNGDIDTLNLLKQKQISVGKFLMHEHAEGPWCWVLENIRECFVPDIKGHQGLWEFDERLLK